MVSKENYILNANFMERKEFLKKGIIGLGSIIALPKVVTSCSNDASDITEENSTDDLSYQNTSTTSSDCTISPTETKGPFPIKTPADLVRENIISDRTGVPLLITLTVQDQSDNCSVLEGVYVDVWHCDKDGYYSEYGGTQMQQVDFTDVHFLRGRQLTDTNGQVSFLSIYPGWYSGRAPHIHLEVKDKNNNSLKVTQIAFPEDISNQVYATNGYNGSADTSNSRDNIFSDSLDQNMLDSLTGNIIDGFTLLKTIVV